MAYIKHSFSRFSFSRQDSQREEDEAFFKKYELTERIIGKGQFSTVFEGVERLTDTTVAIKTVNKRNLRPLALKFLRREILALKKLNHKHVVKLYDVFEGRNCFYIVTEFCEGGELFDRIVEIKYFFEPEAAPIIKILAETLKHCHERGVIHRDLKPQNILLAKESLKLADFGFAAIQEEVNENSICTTLCGTNGYIAPEVITGRGYGSSCDVWGLGILAYILLCGCHPFLDIEKNQRENFEIIKRGVVTFDPEPWSSVSEEAKHFVKSLLVVNPEQRLTLEQVLCHPWLNSIPETTI